MSLGILALMCEEKDMMCISSQNNNLSPIFLNNHRMREVYVEQEKCVLMDFHDSFLKIIDYGTPKGKSYSFHYLNM